MCYIHLINDQISAQHVFACLHLSEPLVMLWHYLLKSHLNVTFYTRDNKTPHH